MSIMQQRIDELIVAADAFRDALADLYVLEGSRGLTDAMQRLADTHRAYGDAAYEARLCALRVDEGIL